MGQTIADFSLMINVWWWHMISMTVASHLSPPAWTKPVMNHLCQRCTPICYICVTILLIVRLASLSLPRDVHVSACSHSRRAFMGATRMESSKQHTGLIKCEHWSYPQWCQSFALKNKHLNDFMQFHPPILWLKLFYHLYLWHLENSDHLSVGLFQWLLNEFYRHLHVDLCTLYD